MIETERLREMARVRNSRYYWKDPEKIREKKRLARIARDARRSKEEMEAYKIVRAEQYRKWRERNHEVVLQKKKAYYAANRDHLYRKIREYRAATKYGSTPEALDNLLKQQGGMCAICGTKEPKSKIPWHVDHDHVTGKVRGILCHGCNTGMGHMGDDPQRLRKAVEYLEKARS